MKRLVPMFDNSGARYSIPEDRVDEFRADMGEVAEARRYRDKDGRHYTIPQDQDEAFRADMPDAVPVRSYTMADGTRRDFTMSEMSKFLRSKEYRESEDYTPPQMGSPTLAGVKGALAGAAEGAYYGGKNALAKVATALPEAAASVGEAIGNTINLGGNAKNAVGDWLRASGQQTKRWLGENIRGDKYDENGNLVMSGLTKDLGYEDALTKIGETAGDAAAMAVKFAPAAVAGPAYMETILASDGINAFADTFDRVKAAGYSDAQANLAGTAAGLINYYGAKLMMKGGAATKDIANPLLRALAGTAFTGAATGAQAVGNKGVENVIEGKPITEGMLGAAGEGFVEGAQFHLINEVGTNAKQSLAIRRETREMREMRKQNLLTAIETPEGRAFVDGIVKNDGVDAAIRARKEGKDVSRRMGAEADLPDNMSAAERNAVIDGISKAREARAERVRTKMDDVQAQSLADEIGQNLMGGASNPMFEDIWLNATRRIKDATELDEPGARARIVGEAISEVAGREAAEGGEQRKLVRFGTESEISKENEYRASRRASLRGQEERARRKEGIDEYELQERERIAREKAEQDAQIAEDERARAAEIIGEGAGANVPVRKSSEYKAWLRKHGRSDTDKNFNRYVAERGLDASLKVERGHNGPNEETRAELEMGRRIEQEGEAQRAGEQEKYDEKMTSREEAKSKAARAAKEKQVAEDWEAAFAERKREEQEKSRKGQDERARRKAEMAEYEFGEEIRKAREAEEERGEKPSISVAEQDVVPPSAESRVKDYPEYASWIKKNGRLNNDKNWNKWVLSNGLDPRLTVERNRGPKLPEKPTPPELRVEEQKKPVIDADLSDLSKKTAKVDKETGENAEIVATNAGKTDKRDISHSSHLDIYTPGDAPGGVEGARIVKSVSGKTGEKKFQIVLKNGESIDVGPVGKNGKFGIRKGDDIRGPFDTLGNAVRKANELYGGEKKPAKVPDGRGRMVEKKNWRTSKVDEVDADGKPYTEAEKMRLRQDKAMTFIDETFKDSSRKNLEAAIKAFEDIESEGGFGKDSSGASPVSSVRRVAHQIATSNFATPEEKARFKKYYEGKPQPPQTRENAPSGAPQKTQPMSQVEAAKPVEARNGASDGEYIDWEGATANKTYKIRVKIPDFPEIKVEKPTSREDYLRKWEDVVKQIDEAKRKLTKSPPVNRKTGKRFKPNTDEYRKWQAQEYALDEKARRVYAEAEKRMGGDVDDLFPEAEDVVAPSTRVPDGKGRMVTKTDGNGVYEKIANAEPPIGLHPKFKKQNAAEMAKIGVLAKDGKMPVAIEGFDGGASKPNYVEFKYADGSSQKVYGDINSIKKWADGVGLKPPVRPAPTAKADAEVKKPNSIVDADTARTDENWGFRKATNAIEFQEQMDALENYKNHLLVELPEPPINPKTKRPYGKNTPKYKEWAEKRRAADEEYKREVDRVKKLIGEESEDWGTASEARAQEIVDKAVRFDKKKLSRRDELEYDNTKIELENAFDEISLEELRELTDGYGNISRNEIGELSESQTRLLDAIEAVNRFHEQASKYQRLNRDKDGRPIFQIDTATPAQKLADPDFKAWARKQGRTPTDGARRIYDAQRVDAVFKVAKNWLKGVKMRRSENAAEVPNGARMLYSRDGNVVGWYDRAKKELVTLPGADAATVAHELGWHATYDYAQAEAAQGRTALLDKLTEYANNAPQSVKNEILRKYGMATDAEVLLDEIGAARYTMDNVNKIKDAATRRQTAKWYQRTWNAIADTYKAMLSKMGWNKARLDNLSALTPEETVNLLADEMLKGRNLGKAKSAQIDMSKDESIEQLHDRKIKDRLRPIEEIEKDAGKSVGNSAYTLFRTLPGKVQKAIDEAKVFEKKVKDECKKAGIKTDEINELLYASAAPERNAKVLSRNGRLDGSAMSHADIQRILSAYRNSPKYAAMRRIADMALALQKKGFDFRRDTGLISYDTWHTLSTEEPNHVPMKSRFDPNGEHMGFSLTEQFGKPEWKTAEGRTNVGDGPLEWIVQEYVDAFSRGHENIARRALLETVLAHPEVGEVKKLGPNDAIGEVKRKGQQGDPNVFVVKTDGDTYQVKLNGTRGELIARAVSGRGLVRSPQPLQKAMRWWSAAATSWSPTFAVRNFLADTVDVFAVNIGEKGLIKGLGASGKHVKTALKLTNAIRKYASTGETTDPLIREAVDAGVLMGGGVRGQAFADAGEAALKTLKTDWRNGKNRIKAIRNFMFGWIDTLNQTAELMNRMADYKLQMESLSKANNALPQNRRRSLAELRNEAALHAREITVDFNEKGELTPVTNMLYMFSNSTLGATMRLNKAIFASKEGKSLVAGTFALGLIEGTLEALANGDDEDGKDMNEYTRANSFYFRKGKDIYRIPLHASPISVIKYAGNCAARKLFGTLRGDKAAEQIAKDMIGMMTSFLGIGALGDNEAAAIAPTIIQPFLQAYMNRDFADRPIERTSFSEEKPKSGNGRPSTPQFYHDLAKWLNEFGGGNAGRKGEFLGVGTDFSPEMLKHFNEATGKNALRDIENTVEFVKMVLRKTDWDRRNIPVGHDYFRTTGGNDNRFFEAVRAYKTDASDFKERTGADRKKFEDSHPWLKEGRDGRTTVNRLINMTNRDKPRDGIEEMGITQLRKLTEGKIRRNDGTYFKPNTPVSDELKEKAKEWLQKRQARVIEIMGK